MSSAEVESKQVGPGRNFSPGSVRMKLADLIYVLDIQNKNRHIGKVLAKYGVDEAVVEGIKDGLKRGSWKVQKN